MDCKSCGRSVHLDASGRPPPWCPGCGQDFRAADPSPPPETAAPPPPAEPVLRRPVVQPPPRPLRVAGMPLLPPREHRLRAIGVLAVAAAVYLFQGAYRYWNSPDRTPRKSGAELLYRSPVSIYTKGPSARSGGSAWWVVFPVAVIGLGLSFASVLAVREVRAVKIGRIPGSAAAPDGTGPVRVYRGVGGEPPPEIQALGQPCHRHALGKNARLAYVSYADALVLVDGDDYTVIPWQEIAEFQHTRGFVTSDGQKFALSNRVSDYGPLYDKLRHAIQEFALPRAVAAVAAGGTVEFRPFAQPRNPILEKVLSYPSPPLLGPLSVSTAGLRYQGKTLAWSSVAGLKLVRWMRYGVVTHTNLIVQSGWASFDWCRVRLDSVPNGDVLLELVRRLCPEHLLVFSDSTRRWW